MKKEYVERERERETEEREREEIFFKNQDRT